MQLWVYAWHYPHDIGRLNDECLKELKAVLANEEQWGILIKEDFEVVKFSVSMTIIVGLSLVIHMVTEELGRTIVGSLRASFIGIFAAVICFGVLSHPAMIDVVRDKVDVQRMTVFISSLVAGGLMDAMGGMMSMMLRRTLNSLLIVSLLVGLLYGVFF
jgi:hypothetical protein